MQCLFLYTFHTEFEIEDGKQGASQLYSKRVSNRSRQKENGENMQFFIENIKGKIPTWRQSNRNLSVF